MDGVMVVSNVRGACEEERGNLGLRSRKGEW